MDACLCTRYRAQKAHSKAIDAQRGAYSDTKKLLRDERKILLLGCENSGKTTILKQVKIVYQNGFSNEERTGYRRAIFSIVLDSAQRLLRHIESTRLIPLESELVEKILNYQFKEHDDQVSFPLELAEAINQMCQRPAVLEILGKSWEKVGLMETAIHFFDGVLRIGSPDYVPTDMDILKARQKSTALTEARLRMGDISIRMIDVGNQSSERRKWYHCFEAVSAIIFCAALCDYDVPHPGETTRMLASIDMFDGIINSPLFARTNFILFLTKVDIFKDKLSKVPLGQYFTDYSGDAEFSKAAKHIQWKYTQTNRSRRNIYPFVTQATDSTMMRYILATVQDIMGQESLRPSILH